MPLQATSGAASYDAFGGGAAAVPQYIEDVFSTYLYTGNGSTQTITNGINLSGNGGLVWIKWRNTTYGSVDHNLYDTSRGVLNRIYSNLTAAETNQANSLTAFNSDGFTLGGTSGTNGNNANYVSWTFRKQPKFFDVVTWSGTGGVRTLTHNLGSTPGSIFVKKTIGAPQSWAVYHRSLGATKGLALDLTNAADIYSGYWNNTEPTATQFTVGSPFNMAQVDDPGATYVAYLFAHDAGGFGLTGTDNVISCGSYTGTGSSVTVDIGYEPQWILTRNVTDADDWFLFDNMRGIATGGTDAFLRPNLSNAENTATDVLDLTATGFKTVASARHTNGKTYIYIAIRRGPMKVPTSGTSVFTPVAVASSTSNGTQIANSFVTDMAIGTWRDGVVEKGVNDRLRGISTTNPSGSGNPLLKTNTTGAETTPSNIIFQGNGNATMLGQYFAGQGYNQIYWLFGRAPSFFDEVCYTGTGSNTTFTHNLGVTPEMMIFKRRDTTANWRVYHSSQPASDLGTLNSNIYFQTDSNVLNSTAPTSSVFTVGTNAQTNASGGTYVAYLFATTAGVSKIGSYTGTGTTLQINCGFTGGSRFVLIKRVDDSADWYVWDSARGIVSGNDPYLLLNSTAAEVTNTDYIDTYSAGFEISSTAPAAINASGGIFMFLAIA